MKKTIGLLSGVMAVGLWVPVIAVQAHDPSTAYHVIGTNLSATSGLLGGLYEPFKVKTTAGSPIDFEAKAKTEIGVIVQRHDYGAIDGSGQPASTGWHHHPGPVFITVLQGSVTFYELDDATCTPHVYSAGQGFVDYGGGHIGRAEAGPAQDITVAIEPIQGPFREPAATNPNCPFVF